MSIYLKIFVAVMSFLLTVAIFAQTPFQGIANKSFKAVSKQYHYAIEANYPQIVSQAASAKKFNRMIKEQIIAETKGFVGLVLSNKKNVTADMPQDNNLTITYKVINYQKNKLISLRFQYTSYFAGAAHPNHDFNSINYDLLAGKKLKLKELFKSGSNYLELLSQFCIKNLMQRKDFDKATVQDGASPKAKNYKIWNLAKKGILITFAPYQVAAYVFGAQEVVVPYSFLQSIYVKT